MLAKTELTSLFSANAAQKIRSLFPGVLVAMTVAATATFLSEHYATPAMLMALLLGIALSFLGKRAKPSPA